MRVIAYWLSVTVPWITLPCLSICGLVYYFRNRNHASFVLAIGVMSVSAGALIQWLSPFSTLTVEQLKALLAASGPPLSWYTGGIISSIGLILTIIGFGAVAFKKKSP